MRISSLLLLAVLPSGFSYAPPPLGKRSSVRSSLSLSNNLLDWFKTSPVSQAPESTLTTVVQDFVKARNECDVEAVLSLVSDDPFEWNDCNFYQPCRDKESFERRLRLQCSCSSSSWVVDNWAVDPVQNTVGALFHMDDDSEQRGCALFTLDQQQQISRICVVTEPSTKVGETGLQVLAAASKIIKVTGVNPAAASSTRELAAASPRMSLSSPPEKYFAAWNRRDMTAAAEVFADNAFYEDTAFRNPFEGKKQLAAHWNLCAAAFPSSFTFQVDQVAVGSDTVAVQWHVNNDDEPLPFTQGCSFYELNSAQRIQRGIDFLEPSVFKPGGLDLMLDSLSTKLSQEPIRWIPLVTWVAYVVIVFFSDGILPGANALELEGRTWKEVFDLSLNFFLVAPLLNLPFSPNTVHPMLEGVFNLLLSWAALCAGFLSDERREKPNLLPMFPMVVGMQFLTSAFLLPYLVTRSSESTRDVVSKGDLPVVARVAGESRILGALMGLVGTGSILWFFVGRAEQYGSDLATRYAGFVDLLSIDRVGSSFLVDLAIFGLFQGWLVDDDLKRRGIADGGVLEKAAKYVPFFGLVAYLMFRPALPESSRSDAV